MKIRLRTIAIVPAAATLLCACSVKEDRTDCPCWLDIIVSGCAPTGREVTVGAFGSDGAAMFSERIDIADYPDCYEREVRKGYVTTAVHTTLRRMGARRDSLLIPRGFDCDSLYIHNNIVDCRWEYARDTAVMHKNFSTVHMRMENPSGGSYPYTLTVRGDVCGIRSTDCTPLMGAFEHVPEEVTECSYVFRLPRQADDSLVLELRDGDGTLAGEIPIGEYIALIEDFSWSALDLKDIWIGVDYARSSLYISVNDWEVGQVFDLVI